MMRTDTSTISIAPFTSRASFNCSQDPSRSMMYATPSQNSAMSSFSRSFQEPNVNASYQQQKNPQMIYTAIYSSVQVYEMEVHGIAVMRRRSDSWLNATQILKVAGVEKGKRTKVLEKEILSGEHEKVQGGYGKYQGTWVNYKRGRAFCRQYGVEELLLPLLEYDMAGDGNAPGSIGVETPTKEQAMAANRKRMFSQTQDHRQQIQIPTGAGTYFSGLSSAASNAISAMTKSARLNSPTPRSHRRSIPNSQESLSHLQASQQSQRTPTFNHGIDSSYLDQGMDGLEPPKKRLRAASTTNSFSQLNNNGSQSMRDGTPTEANDSFVYYQPSQLLADGDIPLALPPLPHSLDKRSEDLLDLFADRNRTDYSSHRALQNMSGQDLDLPLDQSANTALHWAATLARVPLMRLLISKGANIFRGNISGETPLMQAVQVNNCLHHSCFPELLKLLHPLIEIRDFKGRTILHHIAVASGIKGRAASSKYYLVALLEYLVRKSSPTPTSSASIDGANGTNGGRSLTFLRFISEMVNIQDISGNTALNLAARINNISIIEQLMEVQADPTIANHHGLAPIDFDDPLKSNKNMLSNSSPRKVRITSKAEEFEREFVPSLSSSMLEMRSQFDAELRIQQERIDRANTQIRELSTRQKALSSEVEAKVTQLRSRQELKQCIINLERAVMEIRARLPSTKDPQSLPTLSLGDADKEFASMSLTDGSVPLDAKTLNARLKAYKSLNASLSGHLQSLGARDSELEAKYRKVVALCINVPEDKVDNVLGQLVTAVESETEKDVGRVRDFLKRVEVVTGSSC